MSSLSSLDARIGEAVYTFAQSCMLRHLASLASLLVDEGVWFVGSLGAMLANTFLANTAPPVRDAIFGRLTTPELVEVYTDSVLFISFGTLLKLLFRRVRPSYAKQEKYYITNGDRYSFPSGHSLFAAALARRCFGGDLAVECLVAVFVLTVCWARVAKGRHFPTDTLVGASLGAALAEVPKRFGSLATNQIKLVVALLMAGEILLALIVPRFRTPGFRLGCVFLGMVFLVWPFGTMPPLGVHQPWLCPVAALLLLASRMEQSGFSAIALKPSTTSLLKAHAT